MRAIITALFLILFSQSAGAISNRELYKFCKSYTDAGFDTSKMEDSGHALICQTFFVAVGNLIQAACYDPMVNYEIAGEYRRKPNYEPENIEATIQHFVNETSEMPEYWRYKASLAVVSSHIKISGECPN